MNAEIIPFEFESSSTSIRVIDIDGEPWFVAQDVMTALEYAESSHPAKVIAPVPEPWKGVKQIHTLGGLQDLWCLSEPGLYFLVLRSDKPKALPFQMWLAGEVLPSLRQRGYYGTLKAGDVLRYHNALSRIVKQLETTKNTLSQRILLQQVQGICSTLRLTMPKVNLTQAATTDLEGNHATAVG